VVWWIAEIYVESWMVVVLRVDSGGMIICPLFVPSYFIIILDSFYAFSCECWL